MDVDHDKFARRSLFFDEDETRDKERLSLFQDDKELSLNMKSKDLSR